MQRTTTFFYSVPAKKSIEAHLIFFTYENEISNNTIFVHFRSLHVMNDFVGEQVKKMSHFDFSSDFLEGFYS